MKYSIPYGNSFLDFDTYTNRVLFSGEMTDVPPVTDIRAELFRSLDAALAKRPRATLGILPLGGISLPILTKKTA